MKDAEMLVLDGLDEVLARAGTVLGTSDWITITQQDVDTFAELTGDHQWIHVDVARATASAFGGTVVHGFFTLALLGRLHTSMWEVRGFAHGLNYGLDRVRFPAPMPVGGRLRLTVELTRVDRIADGVVHLVMLNTFEREGGDKPVCVAETIVRYVQ